MDKTVYKNLDCKFRTGMREEGLIIMTGYIWSEQSEEPIPKDLRAFHAKQIVHVKGPRYSQWLEKPTNAHMEGLGELNEGVHVKHQGCICCDKTTPCILVINSF